MNKSSTLLASLLVVTSSALSAATVTYHGTFRIVTSTSVATQITAGDLFNYEFTLNDSIADTDPSTSYATFPGLFTGFTLEAAATNGGTWDPSASGTWSAPNDASADFGQLRVIINGSGFQPIDYLDMPFGDPGVTTSPLLNPTFNTSFTDTGSGQTFGQMFGTISPSSVLPYFFAGDQVQTESVSFGSGAMVPEASSAVLLMGAVAAGTLRRQRRGCPA